MNRREFNKYILASGIGLFLPKSVFSNMVIGNYYGSSGTDTWYGFSNTDGGPDSNPTDEYGVALDRTMAMNYNPSVSGTVLAVNAHFRSVNFGGELWLVVYRGTTLIGKSADISGSADDDDWTDDITIVAEGGQSLNYTSADTQIRYGCSWEGGGSPKIGYDSSEGTTMYYSQSAISGAPPATIVWEDPSATQGPGFILKVSE